MDFEAAVAKAIQDQSMLDMKTEFVDPSKPSRCKWHLGADPNTTPHSKVKLVPRGKILPDILHNIGNTPMVRLNKIPKAYGLRCEMLAKCEFFNPGGSVKDRIAYRMIEEAEKKGDLKPGDVIIEPTSGNTGIGLAMAAAVKGYRCVIVMPEKMSDEKVNALRALGAEIIRTPTEAGYEDLDSHLAVSQRLHKLLPNSIILDQYRNPGNPLAHYDLTGEEILQQCDGKVDMVVVGAGTGGTVTGIARKIKEHCPNAKIIAVDPLGSILAQPEEMNKSDVSYYEVEGIGYDFIPTVLDRSVVDSWRKSNDKDSFLMARRLIREEGLLCGGSSGAAVSVAIKAAASLEEGQRCVVVLPDNVRNYMTKFLSDSWMEARDFTENTSHEKHWWSSHKVSSLKYEKSVGVAHSSTCQDVVDLMNRDRTELVRVVASDGSTQGIVNAATLMSNLLNKKIIPSDSVQKVVNKKVQRVYLDTSLDKLSLVLAADKFVFLVSSNHKNPSQLPTEPVVAILTPVHLLTYITSREGREGRADSESSSASQ